MVDEIFDRHYQAGRSELNKTSGQHLRTPRPRRRQLFRNTGQNRISGTLGSKADSCPLQLNFP